MSLPSLLIEIPEGVIDFGWGHPSPRLHPTDAMLDAAQHVISSGPQALQYGATQGFGPLVESLSAFLSSQPANGRQVAPNELFISAGASQAIDLASTVFSQYGQTVFVEEPTYYLIGNIFRDHGLSVVGVPTDSKGLSIDALEAMLADPIVPNPSLLYTIPTYQNPAGTVLPADRRARLAELAIQYSFVVISDEVYQLLHYGEPPPPPIATFDESESGCVMSLGSFSKILGPGLRLGWVQAKPQLIDRFVQSGVVASGGGVSHFSSALVNWIVETGALAGNIDILRATYTDRVLAMSDALNAHFGDDIEFEVPGGGYFLWVRFKSGINTAELLPRALKAGVSYRPGTAFSAEVAFSDCLRLSFALYETDEINEGVARLANAVKNHRLAK